MPLGVGATQCKKGKAEMIASNGKKYRTRVLSTVVFAYDLAEARHEAKRIRKEIGIKKVHAISFAQWHDRPNTWTVDYSIKASVR